MAINKIKTLGILDNAVTTSKIIDNAVTTSKIIDNAVTTSKIVDGAITGVKLAAGAGGTAWQSVQTSAFNAVSGRGYPCNTTSSAFTVTLPSSPTVGDTIAIVDYAGTFAAKQITLTSSAKINGGTVDKVLSTNREGVTLTFVDTTQGWVATSGVNEGAEALGSVLVDFLIIAGGGGAQAGIGSATYASAAGGAGGYRCSFDTELSGGGGSSETGIDFTTGTTYTITVGAGGTVSNTGRGVSSSISGLNIATITSIGGGSGQVAQQDGGSGGGAGDPVGSGQQPGSGTANQGFDGGDHPGGQGTAGGGGGAGAVGAGAQGGDGLASSITGSSVTRGGGGSGGTASTITGGAGGGGTGAGSTGASTAGTANTGGGGGGTSGGSGQQAGKPGGSGVVIISLLTSDYSGTTSGSPTVSQSGSRTILVYNASGSYTA